MKCFIFVSLLICALLSSTISQATNLEPYEVTFWEDTSFYVDEAAYYGEHPNQENKLLYSVEDVISSEEMDEVDEIKITTYWYDVGTFSNVNWWYYNLNGTPPRYVDNCDVETSSTVAGEIMYWMEQDHTPGGGPPNTFDYYDGDFAKVGSNYYWDEDTDTARSFVVFAY